MHSRTQELLEYLDAQRAALRAAFDAVPPAERDLAPAPGRWSAAHVIEHLAIVQGRMATIFSMKVAEGRASGLGPETSTDPILPTIDLAPALDRTTRVAAPEMIQPTGTLDSNGAWAALERSTAVFRAAVAEGDGLALSTMTHRHSLFGPLSLYNWIALVGAHEARHAAQIRESLEVRT